MNAQLKTFATSPLARVETEGMRIDVERVSGVLQVRIHPQGAPIGLSSGPRIGFEVTSEDARALAALLDAQADALESDH